MRRITQFRCSSVLQYDGYRPNHGQRFMTISGLKPYKNKNKGFLQFGCYNQTDIKRIVKNRRNVIIYWAGSDILIAKRKKWKFEDNVRHVTGTELARDELESIGMDAMVRPVAEVNPKKFKLSPLGKKVFCYLPGKRRNFYGYKIIKETAKRLPKTTFILTRYGPRNKPFDNAEVHPLVNFERLSELYKESACCIRPTRHEGLSQTLLEIGLCGRNTAHPHDNGWGVKCTCVDHYVDFIEGELNNRKAHKDVRKDIIKRVNNFDFLEW